MPLLMSLDYPSLGAGPHHSTALSVLILCALWDRFSNLHPHYASSAQHNSTSTQPTNGWSVEHTPTTTAR
jgi:hypothetical protein